MKYIVYYRLSLLKKGSTGLGLDAQRTMFEALRSQRPGEVLAEYTEIETGRSLKKSLTRPELTKAIAHARAANATLVVGRVDRLARNVAFTSALMESGLDFVCCDMPTADRFTLHIIAAVAEREGELISLRTKAALAEAKKRGILLGSARLGHWNGAERGWKKAVAAATKTRQAKADTTYAILVPMIKEQRDKGRSMVQIRDWLNERGFQTTRKLPFSEGRVWCIINRYLGKEYLGKSKRLGVM